MYLYYLFKRKNTFLFKQILRIFIFSIQYFQLNKVINSELSEVCIGLVTYYKSNNVYLS